MSSPRVGRRCFIFGHPKAVSTLCVTPLLETDWNLSTEWGSERNVIVNNMMAKGLRLRYEGVRPVACKG